MSATGAFARAALRLAWPLPWTLVGVALGAAAMIAGARARRVDHTLEITGGAIGRALRRAGPRSPFVAITFGHVVLGQDRDTLARLRDHERVHVRQYERWGPLFVPLYLGSSAWQWLRGGDAYRDNGFEREAFEADLSSATPRSDSPCSPEPPAAAPARSAG